MFLARCHDRLESSVAQSEAIARLQVGQRLARHGSERERFHQGRNEEEQRQFGQRFAGTVALAETEREQVVVLDALVVVVHEPLRPEHVGILPIGGVVLDRIQVDQQGAPLVAQKKKRNRVH